MAVTKFTFYLTVDSFCICSRPVSENEDIREVMAEEEGRGKRRPNDPAIRRQAAEVRRKFRKALLLEDQRAFIEELHELGFAGEPEKLAAALKIWRAFGRGDQPFSRKP